jgi:hypothetical protein
LDFPQSAGCCVAFAQNEAPERLVLGQIRVADNASLIG